MNKVCLTGRLSNDPQIRYTSNGVACAKCSIAVPKEFKDKDGKVGADFINLIAWRNNAEFMNNHLKKGMRIGVEGKLQNDNYENSDGSRVYATNVIVDRFEFLDNKKVEEQSDPFEDFGDNVTLEENDLPF